MRWLVRGRPPPLKRQKSDVYAVTWGEGPGEGGTPLPHKPRRENFEFPHPTNGLSLDLRSTFAEFYALLFFIQ